MTTTSLTPYLGEGLLNVGDFFQFESILHPVTVGSIAIVSLFAYLRLSSNRTVAPLTIWDEICSIALGSTLAGIINGQSLVRGLQALAVLLLWQYMTSWIGCKIPKCAFIFTKPPLVVAFRGHLLEGLMARHRINTVDIYGALRSEGIFNICEVECVVVEPTGVFSIFLTKDLPKDYEPEVLLSIKGYRELVKADEEEKSHQKNQGKRGHVAPTDSPGEPQDQGRTNGNKDQSVSSTKKEQHGQTKEDEIADKAA